MTTFTISNSVSFAKKTTANVFSFIEKRGNKYRISGLKISTLKEVFSKGYAVKTVKEMQELGLFNKHAVCDGRKFVWSLTKRILDQKIDVIPVR
ncbi:hypothetical protein DMA11_10365 [Marinilabiliaceae bacterium JC017]|nr:hypothetical protein DMA11_10365 [Marinilabiliaceae bacterium JC017]